VFVEFRFEIQATAETIGVPRILQWRGSCSRGRGQGVCFVPKSWIKMWNWCTF